MDYSHSSFLFTYNLPLLLAKLENKWKNTKYNYRILINPKLTEISEIEKTLLHEMCHHSIFLKNKEKYWNNEIWWHGKEWKEEMERVGFKRPITRFS